MMATLEHSVRIIDAPKVCGTCTHVVGYLENLCELWDWDDYEWTGDVTYRDPCHFTPSRWTWETA